MITNTGLYGARNNEFIPQFAHEMTAEDLAEMWINEYENGIDKTSIKPGFIKISVDNSDSLSTIHQKLVKAAALTHLETGLTIASDGNSKSLWPQLKILKENGVSPKPNAEQLNDIKTMVEDGDIKPIADLIYSFEDGIDAYEYLATGRAQGKVIISSS
ncbi:zinc-binding dehydrogenase [Salegentibacter sp. JZCK2]|nr:zinc-binding dehydrogenase [Salegentibacter tibetensis]